MGKGGKRERWVSELLDDYFDVYAFELHTSYAQCSGSNESKIQTNAAEFIASNMNTQDGAEGRQRTFYYLPNLKWKIGRAHV